MKDKMVDYLQLARSNICPRRVFQTCVSEARKKKKVASSRWLFLIYLSVFFTFQQTCPPHPPPSSSASRSPTCFCLHRPPSSANRSASGGVHRPDNLIERQSQGQRARHNPCRAFSSKHFYPPCFTIYIFGRVVASLRKRTQQGRHVRHVPHSHAMSVCCRRRRPLSAAA